MRILVAGTAIDPAVLRLLREAAAGLGAALETAGDSLREGAANRRQSEVPSREKNWQKMPPGQKYRRGR